jgi:DNA-3-methyladenine glycosylase II
MNTFEITPRGPFSLRASTRFLEGFAPAHYRGGTPAPDEVRLRLAFPVEGTWQTAGVAVTQTNDATVITEVEGPELDGLREQLARILSLDVDGTGFAEVRRRDAVVDMLARAYPGSRPVCFNSPYEAACWSVIGHRIRIVQAAAIKERIAETYGEKRIVDGVELAAFPDPRTLEKVVDEIKLPEIKIERLRGIAAAALDGRLNGAYLRTLEPAVALEELKQLNGIGPFSAELILIRGAGAPDFFPSSERRLHDSMVQLYQLADDGLDRLTKVAEGWSPYRSWVSVLIRTHREDTTGEISRGSRTRSA